MDAAVGWVGQGWPGADVLGMVSGVGARAGMQQRVGMGYGGDGSGDGNECGERRVWNGRAGGVSKSSKPSKQHEIASR